MAEDPKVTASPNLAAEATAKPKRTRKPAAISASSTAKPKSRGKAAAPIAAGDDGTTVKPMRKPRTPKADTPVKVEPARRARPRKTELGQAPTPVEAPSAPSTSATEPSPQIAVDAPVVAPAGAEHETVHTISEPDSRGFFTRLVDIFLGRK